MSQSIRQANSELPVARKHMPGQDVAAGHLAATHRVPNESPFDIINGVAYPRNGFFSIDCVISFLYCEHVVSIAKPHFPSFSSKRAFDL